MKKLLILVAAVMVATAVAPSATISDDALTVTPGSLPASVVVGGGVSQVGDLFLDAARESFREALEGSDHRDPTPIVCAALREDAGVIGAGLHAWESLL